MRVSNFLFALFPTYPFYNIAMTPRIYLCLILILSTPVFSCAAESFDQWKADFYKIAQKKGISHKSFNAVMGSVTSPDPRVIKKANYQPEFTTKIWDYLDARITPLSIAKGQKLAIKYKDVLDTIEKQSGVSRNIILAIWSMESNYGAILAKTERLHYVPRALATLAYQDKKRAKFARNQLLALLQMVEDQDVRPRQLMGSWAGAMGHTQFIPTSYKAYGKSIDGTPGVDIWHSIPDALATAANLLSKNGWRTAQTWGYEVTVPQAVFALENQTKIIADWQNLGVTRTLHRKFYTPQQKAILKTLGGTQGPGFLAIKNFFVIKKYNNSDYYALAVGLLADQIAGYQPMQQKWPRPHGSLSLQEKYEVQQLLKARGHYKGVIDGNIGGGSRAAIRAFQKATGHPVTGKANQNLLSQLKK